MLRRLDLQRQWRCLDPGFWPNGLPMGSRTVVYGHNGSGKSTLAELLLGIAEGRCETDVTWEHEDAKRTALGRGSVSPPSAMAVFTRRWVEENLSDFLDGEGASAIVTLGREAIDAKEREVQIESEIERLRVEHDEAEKARRSAASKVEKVAREVQEQIVGELKEFDYDHFTKHRFSITKVQGDLREYSGEFPDSIAHAEALKRLGEGAAVPVDEMAEPPSDVAEMLVGLPEFLDETPSRVAIAALDGNPSAQAWVERGLDLHGELDHCLFCAGAISAGRREQLARHFDDSWLEIRAEAKRLLDRVADEKSTLAEWLAALPAAASILSDLQPAYTEAIERVRIDVDERIGVLGAVANALEAKAADPSATPESPDSSKLRDAPPTAALIEATREHNAQARRHEELTAQRKRTVLDHLVGSRSTAFRELEEQAASSAATSAATKDATNLAERQLAEVRQARFTTKDMADTLTRDLARVYGKDHLNVAVTADGKSYACRRGDKPGTNLSDGERTTLSLLYFLRKLEDEQTPGGDPSQRIVVIDDPSSSLDREALFATHQWLVDTLGGFGQYIVLTHDFSLLQLFVKSNRSAWGKSMSKIQKGDEGEARFPGVAFLEIYAVAAGGVRRSRVGKLPRTLLKNTSEYAYLFSMVMTGVAEPADHERLFLLPNAARRVIEVFASYKAPHRTDFTQQLEVLVQSQEGEPFRDVYNFCNRYSHGEGSESVDVLDARAVHAQVRRSMEFLRSLDPEHFERMCAATDIDPATL